VSPGIIPNGLGGRIAAEGGHDMTALVERMRRNPAADWTIRDVETVCAALGLRCSSASGGGSHYKVSHPSQREILTVPARRPIKPIYIRKLVRMIDAVGDSHGTT
jgi:hypothetical protein